MPSPTDPEAAIAVTVVRTGGLAGVRREWSIASDAAAEPSWLVLIEQCPWDDVADVAGPATALGTARRPDGVDRFAWSITAACGPRTRRAELAERDVAGPWRDLVDAVRRGRAEAPASPGQE